MSEHDGAVAVRTIDRADDPRIEDFRELRERDLGRRGVFIAEGEVVVRVLLGRGRFAVRSVLLGASRVRGLEDALARHPGLAVHEAAQPVLDAIAGFALHRGVLASADRGPELDAAAVLAGLGPGPRRVVALEGVVNHDNVGGIFRNAAAFGADAVLLDEVTCDPLYRKAIRVSVGASLFVPFARLHHERTVALLQAHGFTVLALTPADDAVDLSTLGAPPGRVALLLGAEGPGLSEA
ncbi:MAG: RNA methyltransferase, partial [Myxococcales bacterium]